MFNRDWRADWRALGVRVVTAVSIVAILGLVAGESPAAAPAFVRAQVQDGIPQITGTPGADKAALGPKPGNPHALDVDVDNASLGTGDDRFTWDPGAGSDAVDGGNGRDTLVFDGSSVSEHMDLSADSSHVHLFRDVGDVTMDLSTIETADVNATGGADTITVNDLTDTGLQTAAIDLGATPGGVGDGRPDTVIANGTDHADHVHVSSPTTGNVLISGLAPQIQITGSEPANDTLNINTLAGNGTAAVASGVSGVIQPIIDLAPMRRGAGCRCATGGAPHRRVDHLRPTS